MTQALELSVRMRDLFLSKFDDLKELQNQEGGPYLRLSGRDQAEIGVCRIWKGNLISKLVYIGLTSCMEARHMPGSPTIKVDSHMLFAFADIESSVPHFTLDSVYTEVPGMPMPILAFHLDLIPRVDLAANLKYMDFVYGDSLTSAQAEMKKIKGITPAHLSSRQLAVMSPWMLANRATPEAFECIPVNTYFDKWFKLVQNGIPLEITPDLSSHDFSLRDKKHRKILFSKDVDPVWSQIENIIGEANGIRLRDILQEQQ